MEVGSQNFRILTVDRSKTTAVIDIVAELFSILGSWCPRLGEGNL